MISFIQFISEGSGGKKHLQRKLNRILYPKSGGGITTDNVTASRVLARKLRLKNKATASSDTDQFWDKEIRDHDRKKRRESQKQFKKIRKFGGYPETRDPKSVTKKNFRSNVFEGSNGQKALNRKRISIANPNKGPSRWTSDIGYRMAYKSGSSIIRKRNRATPQTN